MRKIKKGDEVIVLSGRDKGKSGSVTRLVGSERLEVGGINIAKKHVRPNPQAGVDGGIVSTVMPVHISNVALLNPETGRADRVGFRTGEDGTKVRFFKSNGNEVTN